ncbi:hypothetical protein [Xanthobacter sediminis]|uniref:hypothetical protein n=1 Tax=Xanthobacter sediminis TaxID=3119926 RepID=UPI00372BC5F1
MPTCLPFNDRLWRIWFGGRDGQRRSRPLCVDVDPGDGMRILALRDVPGLDLGREGAFDSAGLWPSAVLETEGRVMMWYTGMRLDHPWPYSLAIGLAVSRDGGLSFEKQGEGPVLPAGEAGRFATSPCVRRVGRGFEMWYSRCTYWRATGPEGALDPYYDIQHRTSPDGVTWVEADTPVLALDGTGWAGLTRPWLDDCGPEPILWFSARGPEQFRQPSEAAYRIYGAPWRGRSIASADITPAALVPAPVPDDWDSWMRTCACVTPYRGGAVMLYHGNDFGSTGFGYAVSEEI